MNTTKIKKIRDYYEQLYTNKFGKLEEIDNFLETLIQPTNTTSKIKRKPV
jgi:hypothetical protein